MICLLENDSILLEKIVDIRPNKWLICLKSDLGLTGHMKAATENHNFTI